jgi:hypothetical protein
MGSVMRHWRWLACSALAVGCLLNPQPDLPTARPGGNDGASGGSGPVVGSGASQSTAGAIGSSAAGGPASLPGGFGGTSAGENEGGMGGDVELTLAGATGESGQAGDTQRPTVGTTPP